MQLPPHNITTGCFPNHHFDQPKRSAFHEVVQQHLSGVLDEFLSLQSNFFNIRRTKNYYNRFIFVKV